MTTIGILSDTHGKLPLAAYEALAISDFIVHAGDICDPGILRQLKTLAPVTAVLGNNDFAEYGEEVGRFASPVIDGVRLLVAHYPHEVRIGPHGCARCASTATPTCRASPWAKTRVRHRWCSTPDRPPARAADSRPLSHFCRWKQESLWMSAWNRSQAKPCLSTASPASIASACYKAIC